MMSVGDIIASVFDALSETSLDSEKLAPLLREICADCCADDLVDEDGWVKFDTYGRRKMARLQKLQEVVGLEVEELKRLDGQEWVPLPTATGFKKAYGYIFTGEDDYDDLSDFA